MFVAPEGIVAFSQNGSRIILTAGIAEQNSILTKLDRTVWQCNGVGVVNAHVTNHGEVCRSIVRHRSAQLAATGISTIEQCNRDSIDRASGPRPKAIDVDTQRGHWITAAI